MYSVPLQTLTAEHCRLIAKVGARVWHVVPSVHTVQAVQVVDRWLALSWYLLAGHALQVRAAVDVSADIFWPATQDGWAAQDVLRWLALSWYVSAGHALQVRWAVRVTADITSPAPHVGCVGQDVRR